MQQCTEGPLTIATCRAFCHCCHAVQLQRPCEPHALRTVLYGMAAQICHASPAHAHCVPRARLLIISYLRRGIIRAPLYHRCADSQRFAYW